MSTDPNFTQDNEYVSFSPLTLEDVRNFFNSYIKPFAPYSEEKIYDTLINNLVEYYYNYLYFSVPNSLKQFFEEANFGAIEIYDKLLIAIGVPKEIIYNLSVTNKIIFLKTLADFERYKGTVSFFQKVANAFSDRISIYELFIDREGTNWVFKPVVIYQHSDMDCRLDSIPYATIYNSVPSLLVSEEQLEALYEEEKLILPLKSNILLFDNDLVTDVSILYDVIVAVFLHTYKDNYLDIYFQDQSLAVQLKTVYFLWYYLLTRYYNVTWTAFAARGLLRFVYSDLGFPLFIGTTPTTIDNLQSIIDRYNDIEIVNASDRDYDNCQKLRDELFKDISEAFYTFDNSDATTYNDMFNELLIENAQLITYIDDRINSSHIGQKEEINLILNEIYSSLLLYASTYSGDSYFDQYVDYFLRYLPQILVSPDKTVSYTILYNLKPYHVEIYSIWESGIRCSDKFNQVFIDDESLLRFIYRLSLASVLSFSVDYLFGITHNAESPVSILSGYGFKLTVGSSSTEELLDLFNTCAIYIPIGTLETISNDYSILDVYNAESPVSILSGYGFKLTVGSSSTEELLDLFNTCAIYIPIGTLETISNDYSILDVYTSESSLSIIQSGIYNLILNCIDDLSNLSEALSSAYYVGEVSASQISDDYELIEG